MENNQLEITAKINEVSSYGYFNHFNFNNGMLELKKTTEDETVEIKSYVAQQISVESEFVYEDKGTAVVTLMTNDGELGYVIDYSDANGNFPVLDYFESFED